MNSVALSLQNGDTLSQAYIYALQHMNMYNIVEGLRDALGNPSRDHRIPLFEYYRTDSNTESPRMRQRLASGVYLDETFNLGLYALLRRMFETEGRVVEVYDRRRTNRDGNLNPHVRQVVLLVNGRRGRGV
jgi:hypothetical protein